MEFILYFKLLIILLFGLIWISLVALHRLKKKKSLVYLLFLSIFYAYLFKVLDYTLFQFQSLLFLKYFVPGLMLQGQAAGESMNLIPLVTLTLGDVKTSLLNILLMVPFGFGLPFITDLRMKNVVQIGMLLSIGIEVLQFISGLVANMTFRVADVNDVIFNTLGVTIGYVVFIGLVRICRRICHSRETSTNPLLRYINERPQI
ncbi:MAG: VanZ family protein [Parcubacteria group bacterium]|nr:VanZ family protein [Parcubacteria group bacterium]